MNGKIRTIITILLFVISIVFLTTYIIKSRDDTFADEIISDSSTQFSTRLVKFLSSVQISIQSIESKANELKYGKPTHKQLNEEFARILNKDKYLVGIVLSAGEYTYLIHKEKTSLASTYDIDMSDTVSNWQRLNRNLEVVSEWTDIATTFPNKSNIDRLEKELQSSPYVWNISNNLLSESESNFSIVFKAWTDGDRDIYAGLIYDAISLSGNFASVLKYDRPLVSIITKNDNIVTPIITTDTASISKYEVLSNLVETLINTWRNSDSSNPHSFSFEKFNETYWTRIAPITPMVSVDGFAVTISAMDLAKTEHEQEKMHLYLTLIFVFLALLWWFITRKRSKFVIRTAEPVDNDELLNIINKGESEFVEFKSSLRWDYREEKVNKVLETVILKSISAFANAKGGSLFIGITDEMEIIGLEKDFNTLRKKDVDYFELHLRKLIVNQFGITFSNDSLSITFNEFDNKTICLIRISACDSPVFLKTKNKQGAEIEKFYVRSGNASQEISSLTEMNDYIQTRFENI